MLVPDFKQLSQLISLTSLSLVRLNLRTNLIPERGRGGRIGQSQGV